MALYVREKILSPEVCEKNSYAKQITHIPLKSQMVGPLPISLLTSFGAVSTTWTTNQFTVFCLFLETIGP